MVYHLKYLIIALSLSFILFISKSYGFKIDANSSAMSNFSSHFNDEKSSPGTVLQRRVCYFANWVGIVQI